MEHELLEALEEYEGCSEKLADLRLLHREEKIGDAEYHDIRQDWRDKLARCEARLKELHDAILHDVERYRVDYERNAIEMKSLEREIQGGRLSFADYEARYAKARHIAVQARKYYNWWKRVLACKSSADLRLFLSEAGALEQEALLAEVSWTTVLNRVLYWMSAVMLVIAVVLPWVAVPGEVTPSLATLGTLARGAGGSAPPYWLLCLLAAGLTASFAFIHHRTPRGVLNLAVGLIIVAVSAALVLRGRCHLPDQPGVVIGFGGLSLVQILGRLGVGAMFVGIAAVQLIAGGLMDCWPLPRARWAALGAILATLALSGYAATMWGGRYREQLELHVGLTKPGTAELDVAPERRMPVDAAVVQVAVANLRRPAARLVAREALINSDRDYALVFERLDPAGAKWVAAEPKAIREYERLLESIVVAQTPALLHVVFAPVWPARYDADTQAARWRITLKGVSSSQSRELDVPAAFDPARVAPFLLEQARRQSQQENLSASLALYDTLLKDFPGSGEARTADTEREALSRRLQIETEADALLARIENAFADNYLTGMPAMIEALRSRFTGSKASRQAPALLARYIERALPQASADLKAGRPQLGGALVFDLDPAGLTQDQRAICGAVLRAAGEKAFAASDLDGSEKNLTRAAEFAPGLAEDAEFCYKLAMSAPAGTERAISRLEDYVARFPDAQRAPEATFRLGQACLAFPVEDWAASIGPRAERAFRSLLAHAHEETWLPYRTRAVIGLAETFQRTGRLLEALALLYSADPAKERDWTDDQLKTLQDRIALVRAELQWGESLGDALDRRELEATLQMREIASADALAALESGNLAKLKVLVLKVQAEDVPEQSATRLAEWIRAGGVVWTSTSAVRLFDVPVGDSPYDRAEAAPSSGGGRVLIEQHPTAEGVSRVIVSGRYGVTKTEGVHGRPVLEISQSGRRLYVCWVASIGAGKVVLMPETIDRTKADGSRFVLNMKLFCLGKDIPKPAR